MQQRHLVRSAAPASRRRPLGLCSLLLSSLFFLLSFATSASAQGAFGIGARMAMINADTAVDTDALRYFGGQIRGRMSPRTGFELSLDRHREDNGDLTQRVIDYPLQATMMIFPVRSKFSPYLLGGFGWYTHKIQNLTGDKVSDISSTRQTGYHAGFGAEVLAGRHLGIHGDYRYTFIHVGDNNSGVSGYNGSMWTAGFTFYF